MINKIIYGFLIAFAAIIVLLLVFMPLIVKNVAERNSKEWIGRSISIDKLKITLFTGTANVVMNDSSYNFEDMLTFYSSDSATEQKLDADPLHFQFSNLEISGALINIQDDVIGKDLELHDLDFFIS